MEHLTSNLFPHFSIWLTLLFYGMKTFSKHFKAFLFFLNSLFSTIHFFVQLTLKPVSQKKVLLSQRLKWFHLNDSKHNVKCSCLTFFSLFSADKCKPFSCKKKAPFVLEREKKKKSLEIFFQLILSKSLFFPSREGSSFNPSGEKFASMIF